MLSFQAFTWILPWLQIVKALTSAEVIKVRTRKIAQLVGEGDRQFGGATPPRTYSKCRLYGADLGAPLDRGPGKELYFLFGDSWTGVNGGSVPSLWDQIVRKVVVPHRILILPYAPGRPFNADAIGIAPLGATAESINKDTHFELEFITVDTTDDGNKNKHPVYVTLEVPGVNLLTNKVPTGGVSTPGGDYLFVTGPPFPPRPDDNAQRSWVARWSDRSGGKTEPPYQFSTGHFANFLTPVAAGYSNDAPPGHPTDGPVVWLWGTGFPNRESSVRLAYVSLESIHDPSAWKFFAGLSLLGNPTWSPDEARAARLFESSSVGEFSVAWNKPLGKWLMLYGCPDPRGILCRLADDPWGPWSSGTIIFDPWVDGGYRKFMHVPEGDQPPDVNHLSDPGREAQCGGEYAPLIISRYTLGSHGTTTIRYAMSLWNPYTVVLMESVLHLPSWRDGINQIATTLRDLFKRKIIRGYL